MLCACLGIGARNIIPTAEAWVPAAPACASRSIDTTTRGASSYCHRPAFGTKSRWGGQRGRQQAVGATFAAAGGGGGGGAGGGWGIAAPTAATSACRQQSAAPAAFSCRSSSWRGRPVANALAVGATGAGTGAGRRGRVAVTMSMAEEGRGGYNAVLGALAIAGLGAVYYG